MDEFGSKKEIEEGRFFAVVSYIGFFCIVALILKKENNFSLYHARQGLALFVFEVVCFILSIIPLLGFIIKLFGILFFGIASLWGIYRALKGKNCPIPFISKVAQEIVI